MTNDYLENLKNMSRDEQLPIMEKWFRENFVYIDWDDRERYESEMSYKIDPYVELAEMFEDSVSEDVINEAARKLAPNSDDLWIYNFDDLVYWDDYEPDAFGIFQTSIERIEEMKSKAHLLGGNDFRQHLFQILYANIFTSFEAYMVRAFTNKLFSSDHVLQEYLSKQSEFKIAPPEMTDLLKGPDHLTQVIKIRTDKLRDDLVKASWHDLGKVSSRFHHIGIDLKLSASGFKAIRDTRNDIVHRNGRTTTDQQISITEMDLISAIKVVETIANTIRAHEKDSNNPI